MGENQTGRDLQELRSRVERLEASSGGQACTGRRGTGIAEVGEKYYSAADTQPIIWQAEEHSTIPPHFNALFGLPADAKIERAQSKTWAVSPEPLWLAVSWSDGRVEEYFRLQNQLVTLTRFTDQTTGSTAAVANYTATVVASGKAKPDPNIQPNHMVFNLRILNAQGGSLWGTGTTFAIGCHDNRPFWAGGRFNPDFYDIAESFHFYFSGDLRLVNC